MTQTLSKIVNMHTTVVANKSWNIYKCMRIFVTNSLIKSLKTNLVLLSNDDSNLCMQSSIPECQRNYFAE
jgi:hypothetical protein